MVARIEEKTHLSAKGLLKRVRNVFANVEDPKEKNLRLSFAFFALFAFNRRGLNGYIDEAIEEKERRSRKPEQADEDSLD